MEFSVDFCRRFARLALVESTANHSSNNQPFNYIQKLIAGQIKFSKTEKSLIQEALVIFRRREGLICSPFSPLSTTRRFAWKQALGNYPETGIVSMDESQKLVPIEKREPLFVVESD
jgi:hypothetical protein